MSRSQVEAIIERWMSDEDFRIRMRASPLDTAAQERYDLSEEERRALVGLDLSGTDEELARQASFGG